MRRKVPLASAILVCIVAGGLMLLRSSSQPPDIVLLVVDTLRADKLGIYGNESPASLELDQVAQDGLVFTKMISQASWTRASMASMLTGRYPSRAGVRKEQWDRLREDVPTLAETLSSRGYTTIGITANPQLNKDFHFERGFDHYVESTVIFPWMPMQVGKVRASKKKLVKSADEVFEGALHIAEESGSQPQYIQLLLMEVHAHHRIQAEEIDEELASYPDAAYLQSIRNVVRPLRRFIDAYRKLRGNNVVFIITADHGEGLRDHPTVHGSQGHGNLLYRSQLHVPCIILGPDTLLGAPRRIFATSRLLDLAPTIVEMADAQDSNAYDGESLFPIIRAPSEKVQPRIAYAETQWRPTVRKAAITDGEWLYVESRDDWKGIDAVELHPFLGRQSGTESNQASSQPHKRADMVRLLREYEAHAHGPNAVDSGQAHSSNAAENGIQGGNG